MRRQGTGAQHAAPAVAADGLGRLDDAWRVVVDGLEEGAYGGAVAAVSHRGRSVLHRATGWAEREPERIAMATGTICDLASLTKVVATLPSVLLLVDRGAVGLDDPVGAILPAFGREGWKDEVTIRRLLNHTAGLAAWVPIYLDHSGPEAYVAGIAAMSPVARPGEEVVYSDLGIILLGEVIRRLSGQDVAAFAAAEVFAPLGLRDTSFRPPPAEWGGIAATERGNGYEREMCGPRAAAFDGWREGMIRGEVHDGNAYYGLAGVAGHAGLFGTARDLLRYGTWWLRRGAWDGRQLLAEDLIAEATRSQAPGRGLGWRVPPAGEDAAGDPGAALGPRAFGHTGFTGTSLWIDPDRELVAVLLTNRVHPVVRPEIEEIRVSFHAAVAAALDEG